ncbi:MAG: hypothetical protein K8L97_20825 [Anaerolineae bacterium]|nr:hypothetical protein [Anaerolineae bacterium]
MIAAVRKRKYLGCIGLLVAIPALTYWVLFLHATHAGEWAARSVIPVPQSSTSILEMNFSTRTYDHSLTIYSSPSEIDDLKMWFDDYLFTIGDQTQADTIVYDAPRQLSTAYILYVMVGNITKRIPNYTATYDEMPDCFKVNIFTPDSIQSSEYSAYLAKLDSALYKNNSLVVVECCWPNWK